MEQPRMLSSVYGEIEEILLVFPGFYTPASAQEYEAITQVFDQKGTVHQFVLKDPNFSIRIAQADFRDEKIPAHWQHFRGINVIDAQLDLPQMLLRWRDELLNLQNGRLLRYSRWAQDPFVTLASGDAILLLQSLASQRAIDFLLPLQLAEAGAQILLKPTRLSLQGGNMLCSADRAYIGRDLIRQNQALQDLTEEEVLAQFSQVLGIREVIAVGCEMPMEKWPPTRQKEPTWQPFFHIDLFLTLGGWDAESEREIAFLGSPALTNASLRESWNQSQAAPFSESHPDVEAACAEIKARFLQDDFWVIDLPIYCRNKVCYTWNNALVEVLGPMRRVYLPSYLTHNDDEALNHVFEILEARVQERYNSAGFQVVWIRSGRFFRMLASHGGSLHCATKVLRRGKEGRP